MQFCVVARNSGILLSICLAFSACIARSAAAADTADVPNPNPSQDQAQQGPIAEIQVTATRQSTTISKVPISVSAYSEAQMDAQGMKNITDISSFTPSINFTQSSINSNISVRGIASTAGSATTAIYIDDTPIQVRVVGTSSSNFYPEIFDLDRVEVLRGPQGTLFGAGAEGGAIRFILPQPSLTKSSSYVRAEVSNTSGGAPSYEIGFAQGGPIVDGKLGFRISAYYRHDGGWINKDTGTAIVNDPTGDSGVGSVSFIPNGIYSPDANWDDIQVYHLALAWKPADGLLITPSLYYENNYINDNITSFWPSASNYDNDNYVTPQWIPTVDANHIALPGTSLNNYAKDWLALPTLHIDMDTGPLELISNTSYTYRQQYINPDYTMLYETTYAGRGVPAPGDFAVSPAENLQQDITQEFRVQTPEPIFDRINVVSGLFYTRNRQTGIQDSEPNFISTVASIANQQVPGVPNIPPAVNNGPPFGPGYSAYINYYGIGLLNGVTSYWARISTLEKQEAVFANVDFNITSELKITGGARFSHDSVVLSADYAGPNSNLNTPHGLDCIPGTGLSVSAPCIPVQTGEYAPGEGPFAPAFIVGSYGHSENSVTPKYGIEYQATTNNLFYVTVSKGFRPGGAQQEQPSTCNAQLAAYGFVDSEGRPSSPTTYNSDSVWSYEIGAKSKLFDDRLQIQMSAYHIDWSNIQTSISLSSCAQSIIDNLGSATSNGMDFQAEMRPVDPLLIALAFGYTNASFNDDTVLDGRRLYSAGSAIPNSPPPVQATISGEYDLHFANGLPAYIRFDERVTSRERETGATDPLSVNYNPNISPVPATQILNARAGVRVLNWDVSLFVNNVTDAHPHLDLTESIRQPLYTDWTFRPRTIGVTAAYRY